MHFGSTLSVCSFIRFGSSGALFVSTHFGSSWAVRSSLASARLVTRSFCWRAFGQQPVGLQLYSSRLVSGSIGQRAPGQHLIYFAASFASARPGQYLSACSLAAVGEFAAHSPRLVIQYCWRVCGQQSVGVQLQSPWFVSGSIGRRALGQQFVSSQLRSPRLGIGSIGLCSQFHSPWLVTSSIGVPAVGQQSVGLQLQPLRLVTGNIGLRALGQSVSSQLHSLRLVTLLALGQQSVGSQCLSQRLSIRLVTSRS